MMHAWVLLAVGMDEWVKFGILVVMGVIYLINYLIGAAGKGQQRRQARPQPRGPRPGGRPEVQDEVAEFLKRAAEKRSGAKTAEARPPQPRRLAPAEIVEAHAVEDASAGRWPQTVQPHVDNRELTQRAAHLTHVDRAETAFQAHMQGLDHTVGSIQESSESSPQAPAATGGPQVTVAPVHEILTALLSDPQNLRQAIILNQIIERPVERW
jgi:hypothetical protein